jgi:hypothetical protein
MRTRTVRRGTRTVAVLAVLTLAATGCSDDAGQPAASGGNPFFAARSAAPVSLQADRSCDAVLEDFQSFAPAVLGDQFFGFGDDMAVTEQSGVAATGEAVSGAAPDDGAMRSAAPAADTADGAGGSGGGTSDTNTQEEGIDEPDVVETDGEHVYLVDQEELVVLDAATAGVVSRTRLASYGAQLLLQGDRLLAISGGMAYGMPRPIEGDGGIGDAEIGIPVEPPTFHAGTVLQLLDVSDPSAPAIVQTTELEGHHVTTRVVDGVARVVVTSYPDQPFLEDVAMDGSASRGAATAALSSRISETEIDDWLPAFRTTVAGDDGTTTDGALVACEDVLMPEVNAGIAQTSILRVDFGDGFDPEATTTVVAEAGTVYASAGTLYLAATRYVPLEDQGRIVGGDERTALHSFDLSGDGAATHSGAGEIPGFVLNQYSLSEHDGHLRVATTEGSPWAMDGAEPSQSGVRVLRLEGDRLTEVGAVTGLGVTETIHSVRFMGPVGYVVTFRQTDPLYVIDLSDPGAPRAVGELKIPGFSSYLHPVAEGRLVGIGRDADAEGRDQGLLLSLFDVSDPTAPTQMHTWTDPIAWSQAGHDPKAFLHWAPESAVVIPVERHGYDPQGRELGAPELGISVFDVDDSGISERAVVTAEGRYPSRALVVQGRLWSLFEGGAFVSEFANPAEGTFTGYR